jgi:uncharacterized protein YbjQ (UPF0145 family)
MVTEGGTAQDGERAETEPVDAWRAEAERAAAERDRAELARAEADAADVEARRAAGRAATDPPWTGAAAPPDAEPPAEAAEDVKDVKDADENAEEPPEPPQAGVPAPRPTPAVGLTKAPAATNGHAGPNGVRPEDGPLTADVPPAAQEQLPIEREVALAIARAGGEPVDWSSAPLRPAEPAAPAAPLAIPAQAPAHESESVLLVTTEGVAGREVAAVHGDVFAVAAWPAPDGGSVHELARDRLAQAVLRRGGNALVGMRYGATGTVGGDVVAYGTAVTLAPTAAAVDAAPRRAGDAADR